MKIGRQTVAGSSLRWFTSFLAIVAVLAGFEIYSLVAHNRERAAAASRVDAPVKAVAPGPVGDIDSPPGEAVIGPRIAITGWALDPAGIRAVEVRIGGRAFAARTAIARPDVAKAKPEIANNANGGYEFTGDFSTFHAPVSKRRTR